MSDASPATSSIPIETNSASASQRAQKFTRRYFLFVHYGTTEGNDYKWDKGRLSFTRDFRVRFRADIKYLERILKPFLGPNNEQWEGRAFVFVDIGWPRLLARRGGRFELMKLGETLSKTHDVLAKLGKRNKVRKVRVIDAHLLKRLLEVLEETLDRDTKRKYSHYLSGGGKRLRYDSPKVPEAAIRIANIGRHVPIFRFDHDVIFYGIRHLKTAAQRRDEVQKTQNSISKLCERYIRVNRNPRIHYYAFSGNYDQPYVEVPKGKKRKKRKKVGSRMVSQLINGYATRILQLAELPKKGMPLSAPAVMDPNKVLKFLDELYKFGANPFRQVISGAGFCLSDGAILDLPPYSNMLLNVMWIDDHLKYSLHHELGHFDIHIGEVGHARVRDADFRQMRHPKGPTYGDVKRHMQTYMTRLLMGCVADAWLRKIPQLKLALTGRFGGNKRNIRNYLRKRVPHVYAKRFFEYCNQRTFKRKLWVVARKRLTKVANAWRKKELGGTFLGLFAGGKVPRSHTFLKGYLPRHYVKGLRQAVKELPERMPRDPVERKDLRDAALERTSLSVALQILVDDFAEYLDFVQFWKFFVYSVRFLLNRDRSSPDLRWMFPPDEVEGEDS